MVASIVGPDGNVYPADMTEEEIFACSTPDCPGMGIDDLCTWPDVEGCGLCTLGLNPDLVGPESEASA